MTSRKSFAVFCVSALASAVAQAGTVTTDGQDLVIKTKGGLEVATADKEFGFKVGGRIQLDYNSYSDVFHKSGVGKDADNKPFSGTADNLFLRRTYLEFSGTAFSDWKYVANLSVDTDKGAASWDEIHLDYVGFKPVALKFGKYEPDFGLEHATSSKWITAMERSMVLDVAGWETSKLYGMQASGTGAGMVYASLGLFQNDDSLAHDGQHTYSYVARAVIAPINEAGNVLHLGLDYAHRNAQKTAQSVKTNMTVKKADSIGLGTNSTAENDNAWMLEAAYEMGPFSAQAEYINRKLSGGDAAANDLEKANGYNVQVAYTLTGESRAYKLEGGKFDAIKPSDKRFGAWEVFYRFDNASGDLAGSGSNDPEATVHTVGVNWYANDSVKVALNYLMANTDNVVSDAQKNAGGKDDGNAITARLQMVF